MRVRVHLKLAERRGVRCTEDEIRALLEGKSDQQLAEFLWEHGGALSGSSTEHRFGLAAGPAAAESAVPSMLGKVRRWFAGAVFGRAGS